MKTIFNKTTRDELIDRINSLNERSTAQWGAMNLYQMLKHCTLYEEMMLGKNLYKRAFIGRLFGKMVLKSLIKNENPLNRNIPTLPELKVQENNGDVAFEKRRWIALIEEYAHFSTPGIVHSFFGKMTKEQIGYLVYKHTDHHLRQFNG